MCFRYIAISLILLNRIQFGGICITQKKDFACNSFIKLTMVPIKVVELFSNFFFYSFQKQKFVPLSTDQFYEEVRHKEIDLEKGVVLKHHNPFFDKNCFTNNTWQNGNLSQCKIYHFLHNLIFFLIARFFQSFNIFLSYHLIVGNPFDYIWIHVVIYIFHYLPTKSHATLSDFVF